MPAIRALQLIPKLSKVNQVGDMSSTQSTQDIVDQYKDTVFQGLGVFGKSVTLQLKNAAVPKAVPARLVPHHLKPKLKAELDDLLDSGVIVKDDSPAEWVSPLVIVNKPNGKVRLCLDPQYLNTQLVRSQCAISTTTEIFARISGSKYFSTLDARQGFHQIELDLESSKLTSFITPYGKYRYTRLPMGICNAPEIFHQRMVSAMEGLTGVETYIDDLLVHGSTLDEHNHRLSLVLNKLEKVGVTLNIDKCQFAKQSIEYLGHELTAEGINPMKSKVEAVEKMTVPEDKKAIERFLGFVNYLAKFIPQLSSHTHPLRQVMKKHTQYMWGVEQQNAFDRIKSLIATAPTLKYFDESKSVSLAADSSAHSIGATVLQEGRPIEFAAKSLTDCQQRYSQLEKELLAVLFACKRFKYYVWGQEMVTVETDHLPLLGILNKNIDSLSPRVAAMRLELQSYPVRIKLKYTPGKNMIIADTLSRSCPQGTDLYEDLAEDPLLSVCSLVIRSDETMNKYQVATANDEELAVVLKYVTAHQGVTKTLQHATNSVFWPGMRSRIEHKCMSCEPCCTVERSGKAEPLIAMPIPSFPYQTIGIDLFTIEAQNFVLVIDYLTKWPVVKWLDHDATSKSVINHLKEIFSDYGLPQCVISDNGPQFSSREFAQFCADRGIEHKTSSPLHPAGNGQVERCVGTVKGMIKKCQECQSDWYLGLTTIRNTPIADGLPSPAELLQGRILRDSLPVETGKYKVRSYDLEQVRQRLGTIKGKDQHYFHSGPEKGMLKPGQNVYFKTASGKWVPGVITKLVSDRSYLIRSHNSTLEVRRNRVDIRPTLVDPPVRDRVQSKSVDSRQAPQSDHQSSSSVTDPVASHTGVSTNNSRAAQCQPQPANPVTDSPKLSRSGRVLSKPVWHRDYMMY